MDWHSHKSIKIRRQGLKDSTHLLSLYTRNGHPFIDTGLEQVEVATVLHRTLTAVSGCRVWLIPPKPGGVWARLKWMIQQRRIK